VSVVLEVGAQAPDFALRNQNDELIHLSDYRNNRVVVLFFYPKDSSAGCTVEACSFRDSYQDFQDAGAEVVGISGGTTETKQAFIQRNRLPFTLLTDADGAVARAYGIGKKLFGLMEQRITFVIDRDGLIRHCFESETNMTKHTDEALRIVRQLQAQPATAAR
jgi:peroxiredoxin Q/BCP